MDGLGELLELAAKVPASVFGAGLLYFLYQLKNSVNHMEETMESLRESTTRLHTTLSVVVSENKRTKEELDRLRDEFRTMKTNCGARHGN